MDFEEQMQEEHALRQILSEDSGETLRRRRDICEQDINEKSHEYNINIAIDIDYEEVENEFAASIVEIKGANVFPCSKCSKICKSKGGLTKHTNSKHGDADKISSSLNSTPLCFDTKSIVDTIKESIIAEKLYGD